MDISEGRKGERNKGEERKIRREEKKYCTLEGRAEVTGKNIAVYP